MAWRRSNPFVNATVGVIAALIGLGWSAKTALFVFTSEPLMGEVISVYECTYRSGRRSKRGQCAEVYWKTPAGYVGTLELKPSRGHGVGSQVPLLYDPDSQGDVRQDAFSQLWLFPLLCLGMGGLFTVTGLVGILRRRAGGF